MANQLKRLDDAVYRAERMLVVSALLIMAVVVFLDVVHRGFAGEASKFADIGIKLAGLFGALPAKDAPEYAQAVAELYPKLAEASPYVLFTVFTGLGYFGIRSTKRDVPVAAPIAAGFAVAGVLTAYGLIRLLIWGMPNGVIWSQPMALVLTLWVGFIGASMCCYERKHLKVEAIQRQIPPKYRRYVAFASGVVTTVVCLLLLWVSLRYVRYNYDEFIQTEGRGGLFQGWAVPRYLGFAALPISFTLMSARFGARAVLALQGKLDDVDPLAGLTGNKDDGKSSDPQSSDPQSSAELPSDIETEAVAVARKPEAVPSEVETMTSQPVGAVVARPSKVLTDSHQAAQDEDRESSPAEDSARGAVAESRKDEQQDASPQAEAKSEKTDSKEGSS
ncbi:MAG: TRAP transporter small permease subunit [Nannocystaceae bacterium]|nr:TRAP transporter small permease subunit [Nannocystaceae bacterium]